MFNFLRKTFGEVATSSLKAENKDVMEAMVAAAALVAYVDGDFSAAESEVIKKVLSSSPQLKVFGVEPIRLFDKYCDQIEASKRMAKLDLMKEIEDIANNHEYAQRVLIIALDVAEADGPMLETERTLLNEIASRLALKLSDFE